MLAVSVPEGEPVRPKLAQLPSLFHFSVKLPFYFFFISWSFQSAEKYFFSPSNLLKHSNFLALPIIQSLYGKHLSRLGSGYAFML
jgi:hypothetical protein